MPGALTELTEIATALGTLAPSLADGMRSRPTELRNVTDDVWERLCAAHASGASRTAFETAFANGAALLAADDGLRGRRPRLVEWKGPHRPPGDEVIPADLRIDHMYLVSCKYLSRVLPNAGPARLFDRLLVGDDRSGGHWFADVTPREFQAFYEVARVHSGMAGLPSSVRFIPGPTAIPSPRALRARTSPDTATGLGGALFAGVLGVRRTMGKFAHLGASELAHPVEAPSNQQHHVLRPGY